MANKLTFGYWNVVGRGQPIRYALELGGLSYNETRYTSPADWFGKDKQTLGLDFPNLPYLIDGDVKLTESSAILDYVIHKTKQFELLGNNEDKFKVTLLRSIFYDLIQKLHTVSIAPTPEEKANALKEHLHAKILQVKNFLGEKDFLLGYLTAADLQFVPIAKRIKQLYPEFYAEFAKPFDNVIAHFDALPLIQAYINSGRHL